MNNEDHWILGFVKQYGLKAIIPITFFLLFILSATWYIAHDAAAPGGEVSAFWGLHKYPKKTSPSEFHPESQGGGLQTYITTHTTSTPSSINSESTPTGVIYTPLITKNMGVIPLIREGIGTKKAKTGSLLENSDIPIEVIRVGDWGDNKEIRGFISFDISTIPHNSEIVSADLYLDIAFLIGDLDSDYFNALIVESVNLGGYLDKSDFNKKAIIKRSHTSIPYRNIENMPHDVSREIIKSLKDGRSFTTFRLRFTERTDSNSVGDRIAINNECCTTLLLIKYK